MTSTRAVAAVFGVIPTAVGLAVVAHASLLDDSRLPAELADASSRLRIGVVLLTMGAIVLAACAARLFSRRSPTA